MLWSSQHGEGQDHVAVLAAHVHVAQTVVGDVPDKVGKPFEMALVLVLRHAFPQRLPLPVVCCAPHGEARQDIMLPTGKLSQKSQ
jgi:hypothetical protein